METKYAAISYAESNLNWDVGLNNVDLRGVFCWMIATI